MDVSLTVNFAGCGNLLCSFCITTSHTFLLIVFSNPLLFSYYILLQQSDLPDECPWP